MASILFSDWCHKASLHRPFWPQGFWGCKNTTSFPWPELPMSSAPETLIDGVAERQSKRMRRTSTIDLEEEEEACHGAVGDILEWPDHVAATMDDSFDFTFGTRSQLDLVWFPKRSTSRNFEPRPIWVTSHYSGLGTVEHCLQRIQDSCDSGTEVLLWSAHEIDAAARHMIMSSQHCPLHVFGDLLEQYEDVTVQKMHHTVQALQQRAKQKALACTGKDELQAIYREANERCMRKLFEIAKKAIDSGKVRNTGYCFLHDQQCAFFPDPDTVSASGGVVLEAGGNSCVGFSPQGARGRWLHSSSVATAAWLCRTEARRPDFVLQECSSHFNTSECLEAVFSEDKQWKTSVVKIKCSEMGVPMTRLRNYSWTINTAKHRLIKENGISGSDFLSICQTPVLCSGHDFFLASDAMVQEHLKREVLRLKRIPMTSLRVPVDGALSPGAKLRLQNYKLMMQTALNLRENEKAEKRKCGVVDISQSPDVRLTLKSDLPSLLCHSHLWSLHHERGWIPMEALLMMGWPFHELHDGGKKHEAWSRDFVRDQAPTDLIAMAGNSMHCRVVGCFMAFCLAMTRPKDLDE